MQLFLRLSKGRAGFPNITRNIVPMPKNFRNECIIIGSSEIRNGSVIVKSEIPRASTGDITNKTSPAFGFVVPLNFSALQRAFGALIAGLQGSFGFAEAMKISTHGTSIVQVVILVFHRIVIVVAASE